ncbi:MAG TPA: xylose isomerase [Solirubrobacteraceae bacterium]|jgi:xylose isomerase|nr:xylose isomerase [Solirubrobacteraceae bacterium]
MDDSFAATSSDRFSFGLWTVGHRGGDPFGLATRAPIDPEEIVARLGEVGAWGVSLHDDDLVPFGSSVAERDRIVARFAKAVADAGLCVPMTTVNLFTQPVFKDGALTAADPGVRRFALRKAMAAIDIGAELGAGIFVLWGGREGVESAAARDPRLALERYREGVDFLCEYIRSQGLQTRVALEAKPNEPRAHIYLPTTGHMLHFIETLAHPEMVGVNPEMAHESMAGLSFSQAVGQALWAGKLFHVDLNSQNGPRYDQDFRFGAEDLKEAFLTVRLLERSGYEGPRHFDARAYRSEDDIDVYGAFARGCIRNYKILAAKAAAFDGDKTIQAACEKAGAGQLGEPTPAFSAATLEAIRAEDFSSQLANSEGRHHEPIDQLMIELIFGV